MNVIADKHFLYNVFLNETSAFISVTLTLVCCMKCILEHSYNYISLKLTNILSTAINQHTSPNTACTFHRFFWMDELHVHIMVRTHTLSKKLEGI